MSTPYFRIFRATGADGFSVDTHAKFVFEPALESDELFDALRNAYPVIKTHSERKRQAVLDFLVQEREDDLRALDRLVNGDVQTTSPVQSWHSEPSQSIQQTPATASYDSFSPSNSNETSPIAITPNFKANSTPTSTTSTNPQFHVWNATSNKPIKLHKRRCMTDQEKEEYRQRRLLGSCESCKQKRRKCRHYEIAASQAAAKGRQGKRSKTAKSTSTSSATRPASANSSPSDTATQNTSPSFLDTQLSFDELGMDLDPTMTGQLFNGDFSLFPESLEPDFFNTPMDQPFHNSPDHFFQEFTTPFDNNFGTHVINQPILSDWLNASTIEGLDASGSSTSSGQLASGSSSEPTFNAREEREKHPSIARIRRQERAIVDSQGVQVTQDCFDERDTRQLLVQEDLSIMHAASFPMSSADGIQVNASGRASSSGRSSASLLSNDSNTSPDLHGSMKSVPLATPVTSRESQFQEQVVQDRGEYRNGVAASAATPQTKPQRVPSDSLERPRDNARTTRSIPTATSNEELYILTRPRITGLQQQSSVISTRAAPLSAAPATHSRPHPAAIHSSLQLPLFNLPEPLLGFGAELRHSGHPLSTAAGMYSVFDFTSKKMSKDKQKSKPVSRTGEQPPAITQASTSAVGHEGPLHLRTALSLATGSFAVSSLRQASASASQHVSLAPASGALAHATAYAGLMMSWYCLYVQQMSKHAMHVMTAMAIMASQVGTDQECAGETLGGSSPLRFLELLENSTRGISQLVIA